MHACKDKCINTDNIQYMFMCTHLHCLKTQISPHSSSSSYQHFTLLNWIHKFLFGERVSFQKHAIGPYFVIKGVNKKDIRQHESDLPPSPKILTNSISKGIPSTNRLRRPKTVLHGDVWKRSGPGRVWSLPENKSLLARWAQKPIITRMKTAFIGVINTNYQSLGPSREVK